MPGMKKPKMMGGGMMKKPMMKKGGTAKLNPGLRAFLEKKKKKKKNNEKGKSKNKESYEGFAKSI